jgi:molybdopterin converting factor small subunit
VTWRDALSSFFGNDRAAPRIRVHVLIKGRIGDGWHDVDRTLTVAAGTTLGELIEIAQREGVPLRDAIEYSPHLRHTLMWNGDRCPVDEHAGRALADGDTLYLLAPVAGG